MDRRRYLPVEVTAADSDGKGIHLGLFMRTHPQFKSLVKKLEFGTLERDDHCCIHKLQETRDRKCELVEKPNSKLLEARGCDPMNKCFQVSANTFEQEVVKVRKCDGCRDWGIWGMGELPFYVTIGNRELKVKLRGSPAGA